MLRPGLRHQVLRDTYGAFRARGMTGVEMAAALGISRSMVYSDLAALGLARGDRRAASARAKRRQVAGLAVRAQRQRAEAEQRVAAGRKPCTRCGTEKDLGAFDTREGAVDGHRSWCRDCAKAAERARYAQQRNQAAGRTCAGCQRTLPVEAFHAQPSRADGLRAICRECVSARERERRERDREPRRESLSDDAVASERALIAEAEAAGVRAYRLRVMRQEPYQERPCCYGDGNGTHAPGCLLGRVARTA